MSPTCWMPSLPPSRSTASPRLLPLLQTGLHPPTHRLSRQLSLLQHQAWARQSDLSWQIRLSKLSLQHPRCLGQLLTMAHPLACSDAELSPTPTEVPPQAHLQPPTVASMKVLRNMQSCFSCPRNARLLRMDSGRMCASCFAFCPPCCATPLYACATGLCAHLLEPLNWTAGRTPPCTASVCVYVLLCMPLQAFSCIHRKRLENWYTW